MAYYGGNGGQYGQPSYNGYGSAPNAYASSSNAGYGYGGGGGGYSSQGGSRPSGYDDYSNYNAPPPPALPPGPAPAPFPGYPAIQHPDVADFRAPPEVAVDPNAFRRFFSYHLSNLTYNSKPAITNLTLFAHQHLLRMSTIVSSCMEEHLRTCLPANRLPALYLLDSISKNIGPPYIALFSRFIERSFLSAYHSVDPPTKTKMEELLGTWRTGGADGGELFRTPDETGRNGRVQRGIESALFGAKGRGGGIGGGGRGMRDSENYMNGMQQLPSVASPDERSGVLFDLRRLLQLRQEQSMVNPEDTVNSSQILALQKLEKLVVDTQLTSDQVYQIRGQLAALAPKDPPTAPPPRPTESIPPSSYSHLDQKPAPSSLTSPPPAAHAPPGIDPSLLAQLQQMTAGNNLAALLQNVVSQSGRNGTPVPTTTTQNGGGGESEGKEDILKREYEEALLSLDLNDKLTTADLLKSRPGASSFLYGRFPRQCQQCGIRFFDSPQGKKQMDKHYDWHFTHKRRIREGAGRAQGRSWLLLEEDWLTSDSVDQSYEDVDPSITTAAAAAALAAKVDRAQLLQRHVPATSASDMTSVSCPICTEPFKSEFSEEEEEWVFYNAEVVDGVIHHATCHAEATASKISAQMRLDESVSNSVKPSRESTPTLASLASLGVKRKLEGEDIGGEEGSDLKRVKPEVL